jgi:hypothetical protein
VKGERKQNERRAEGELKDREKREAEQSERRAKGGVKGE